MKNLFLALMTLTALSAQAHEIEGTLMLKGSLKTKIMVNGIKTTCKLKVEKVKNLLEEDSFGNPGYQAKVEISLDGSDFERGVKVKLDKDVLLTNLHNEGTVWKVRDLEYFSYADKVTVQIDREGRLVSTTFPYANQIVTCKF